MAKEQLRPTQYRSVEQPLGEDMLSLNEEQKSELASLYGGIATNYKQGTIITGTVIKADSDGVLVNIDYKSDGLIPLYEFSSHEVKKLAEGSPIEVMLDELENFTCTVVLSY